MKNQPPPSLVHLWLLRGLHHRSVQAEVVARSKAQQPQQSHLGATGSGKGEKKRAKNMGIGIWYEFQPLSTSPLDMLSTLEHLQVAKLGIFDDS